MTTRGFVLAMQGKVMLRREQPRRQRIHIKAWFLVSRLGPEGQFLLISWAGRDFDAAPPRIVPRLTLVGRRQPDLRLDVVVPFDLLPEAPTGLSIVGRMAPAKGRALLSSMGLRSTLRVIASLPSGLSCRIVAARRPWLGELIDDTRQR